MTISISDLRPADYAGSPLRFDLPTSAFARCPWVQVHDAPADAAAARGGAWRLVEFKFENAEEAGNDHTIYVHLLREDGTPANHVQVLHGWPSYEKPDETVKGWTNAEGNINWAMWDDSIINEKHPRGPYWIKVVGHPEQPVLRSLQGSASAVEGDVVDGMGLPALRHVNYRLTFRWLPERPGPDVSPPPPPDAEPDFWSKARAISRDLPPIKFALMSYGGQSYRVTRTGDGGMVAVGVERPGAIFLMTSAEVIKM